MLGRLMAAAVSGGEAQPNFPDFNKVMMVTGEVKTPKRVLPVFGFNGQELWPSDVGVKLGCQEDVDNKVLAEGEPFAVNFNWMAEERMQVEGGRYVHTKKDSKRKGNALPLQVNKRIRQNIDLSSDDDETADI